MSARSIGMETRHLKDVNSQVLLGRRQQCRAPLQPHKHGGACSGMTDVLPSSANSKCLCEITDPNRRRPRFPSPASQQGRGDPPACTQWEPSPFTGPHRCSDTGESPAFLSAAFGEHIFGHMHMVSGYVTPYLLPKLIRGGYEPPEETALHSPNISRGTQNPSCLQQGGKGRP